MNKDKKIKLTIYSICLIIYIGLAVWQFCASQLTFGIVFTAFAVFQLVTIILMFINKNNEDEEYEGNGNNSTDSK